MDTIARQLSSVAVRNIITFLIILSLVVVPLAYFYLEDTRKNLTDVLSANLAVASQRAARIINAGEVSQIVSPNFLFTPEHDNLVDLLSNVQRDFSVDNAVMYRRIADGTFVYVADGNNIFEIGSPLLIHKRFPPTHVAAVETWESGRVGDTRLFQSGRSRFFQSNRPIKIGDKVVAVLMLNDDATVVATEITSRQNIIVWGVVAAVIVGIIAFWSISFVALRPLTRLRNATRQVSLGNLDFEIEPQSGRNEIAELNRNFISMVEDLRESRAQIEEYNRDLEKKIQERTREIRGLLNNMDEGIFTISVSGEIQPGFSAASEAMLGAVPAGGNFMVLLKLSEPDRKTVRDTFELLVNPDLGMDWEDLLQNVPNEFEPQPERWVHARYLPVFDDDGKMTNRIMVILKDITKERALQEDIGKTHAKQELIVKILQNRENFELFYVDGFEMLDEAKSILYDMHTIRRSEIDLVFRTMHTIKGTAALFGMADVAARAHLIEDRLRELRESRDEVLSSETRQVLLTDIEQMAEQMADARRIIIDLTGEDDSGQKSYTIANEKLERLSAEIAERAAPGKLGEVNAILEKFKHVPVQRLTKKYATLVSQLAQKLGKEVEFRVIGGDKVELDPEYFRRLDAAFLHVIRNSMDHGIEAPELRMQRGKDPTAVVTLTARRKGGGLLFDLADDGQGIDTKKVLQVAVERGFVTPDQAGSLSREQIIDLLFIPGFSSAEELTDLSGRGVGLDVVKTDVAALNGKLKIDTKPGAGTTFQFFFPHITDIKAEARPARRKSVAAGEELRATFSWLAEHRVPLRFEIEPTAQRFFSTVQWDGEDIRLDCPQSLTHFVKVGGWLRFRLPELEDRETCVRISAISPADSPDVIGLTCVFQDASIQPPKRFTDRMSTAHVRDIYFQPAGSAGRYRVVDLSMTGMKIFVGNDEEKSMLQPGRELGGGTILLGKNNRIELARVIPRHAALRTVGIEMTVSPDGDSMRIMEKFLNRLSYLQMAA